MMTTSLPTIVLVPGAWHSPAGYDIVRKNLTSKGWEVEAVALPSVGAEPPTVSLDQDASALRATLQSLVSQGKEIVLIVHSYGGMVGANAVEGLGYKERAKKGDKGGIIMFMYLSAFVAPKGTSLVDMLQGNFLPWMRVEGEYVYADDPTKVFYADVEPSVREAAIADLKHESKRVYYDAASYEPWKEMDCMYFFCEQDQAIPLPIQQHMATLLGPDVTTFTADTSHSPFLSQPDKVVEAIELAAKVGQEKIAACS